MSYFAKTQRPGEVRVATARLHWIIHKRAIFLLAGTVLALAATVAFAPTDGFGEVGAALAFALAVAAWVSYALSGLERYRTEITVTNQRVLYKTGLIARHVLDFPLGKIESVHVVQSLLGRVLDYGTVVLHGTGTSVEPLRNIAHPAAVRRAIAPH